MRKFVNIASTPTDTSLTMTMKLFISATTVYTSCKFPNLKNRCKLY